MDQLVIKSSIYSSLNPKAAYMEAVKLQSETAVLAQPKGEQVAISDEARRLLQAESEQPIETNGNGSGTLPPDPPITTLGNGSGSLPPDPPKKPNGN